MFKRYQWVVQLVFVVMASYLVADNVNTFVSQGLVGTQAVYREPGKKMSDKVQTKGLASFNGISKRNIFNSKPSLVDEKPDEREGPETKEEDIEESNLKVTLVGTVVGPPQIASAILEHQQGREQRLYRLNDIIKAANEEATLIRVERHQVYVLHDGREEVLLLFDEDEAKKGPSSRKASSKATTDFDDEKIRQVSDNAYLIDEGEVENAITNMSQLFNQIRVVPHVQDGKTDGFKVFAIRPGSIFENIGLKNGDILQAINGMSLDSPEKALQLYQQLQNEKSFSVDLLRNNSVESFSYEIR